MARFVFVCSFICISISASGHASVMYISAKPITCLNYAYEIEILQLAHRGSDVIFGGIEIIYGDGIVEDFPDSDFQSYIPDQNQAIIKYVKKHVFQGPGTYKVNARFFNRTANILNMMNSVNTPYYVSTTLTIDPYLGCNTTPTLENLPSRGTIGYTYSHDFSFLDAENDSLSFSLTTPMQDRSVPVVDYKKPTDLDSLGHNISRLSLDIFNGSVFFNSKNSSGSYTVAIQVHEWRRVNGEIFLMSSSILDFELDVVDAYINIQNVEEVIDTAIVAGQSFIASQSFTDQEQDSIQVNVYGDFVQLCDPSNEVDYSYYPGPVHKELRFTSEMKYVRDKPYKLIFQAKDKPKENSTTFSYSNSSYIWITDKESIPQPPKNFMGQAISPNLINLYWNDSDGELGYIIERASNHFPDFVRLAILPSNSTFFNDSSVVDDVQYQYRIRAVGTTMSQLRHTEVTTPDVITGLPKAVPKITFDIYPNPNNGTFSISIANQPERMEIIDLDGTVVWRNNPGAATKENSSYTVFPVLISGIYFLRISSTEETITRRIIVN